MIVFRAKPVASATEVTPPQPKADASVAAHCRRIRSSIRSESERYLSRIRLMVAVSRVNSYWPPFQNDATQIAQVIISRFLRLHDWPGLVRRGGQNHTVIRNVP